jgi:hypothetical protein
VGSSATVVQRFEGARQAFDLEEESAAVGDRD